MRENERVAGQAAAAFASSFPWSKGIGKDTLSTTRGFVFQFPPFPTLPPCDGDALHARPTAGLYLHIPFCPYRCAFCYYAVSLKHGVEETTRYIAGVEKEIDQKLAQSQVARHQIRTAFIGGGTPTVLTAEQLAKVGGLLRRRFDWQAVDEFTVECDPTTFTAEKADAMRTFGANRLSIGVQSFTTDINRLNSRGHSGERALAAVDAARRSGFANINLDLICGLIGESKRSWEDTIDTLLKVSPEHVTIYLLSFRPQTGLSASVDKGRLPSPPGEPERVEMYLFARRRLLDAGYMQTTPNCFIREPRFESIHQRDAWSSLPLIGFGNSAYSFVDDCVTQNVRPITT